MVFNYVRGFGDFETHSSVVVVKIVRFGRTEGRVPARVAPKFTLFLHARTAPEQIHLLQTNALSSSSPRTQMQESTCTSPPSSEMRYSLSSPSPSSSQATSTTTPSSTSAPFPPLNTMGPPHSPIPSANTIPSRSTMRKR